MTRTLWATIAAAGLALAPIARANDGVTWIGGDGAEPIYLDEPGDALFAPPPAERHVLVQHAVEDNTPTLTPPGPPGGRRPGLFQGAGTTYEYLPAFDDESFGHQSWRTNIDFGLPPVVFNTPILISPGYGIHLFDGPSTFEAPAAVHDLQVSFATFRPINDRWLFRGNVIVGVYGDEDSLDDADALQVTGFAMGIYNASPQWQWALGAGYVNNADLAVIPVVGFIHDRGWIKYEVMMPRPRVVLPLCKTPGRESSVYVSGEFGGGVWAVRRASGVTEPLQLSRYGVLFGYEQQTPVGKWRYEFGYAFGRELEYEDSGETLDVDDSLIARIGWNF